MSPEEFIATVDAVDALIALARNRKHDIRTTWNDNTTIQCIQVVTGTSVWGLVLYLLVWLEKQEERRRRGGGICCPTHDSPVARKFLDATRHTSLLELLFIRYIL
jgi:hypothetical protein